MTFKMILATSAMMLGVGTMGTLTMMELTPIRGSESALLWASFLMLCALFGPAYLYYQLGLADGKKMKP